MSASVNECFFLGNCTRDPDISYTPKGKAVAQIGLAINDVWTDDTGQKRENVTFLDLEAWGKTAEIAAEYLKKGRLAHFRCRAKLDSWEDRATGAKRSKVKFVVEKLTLLPNPRRGSEDEQEDAEPRTQRKQPPKRAPKPSDPDPSDDPDWDGGGDIDE